VQARGKILQNSALSGRVFGSLAPLLLVCLLHVLKLRLPKDPAEESLPVSYTVPGSGSFEYPESNSVAKQEHAAHPPTAAPVALAAPVASPATPTALTAECPAPQQ
jgi:hypothetical protein